jgi:general stress protein YciG
MTQQATEDTKPGTGREARHRHGGFDSMDAQKQREIASKGGKQAHRKGTAHEFSSAEAQIAGRKGGEVVSRNRQHMAEIGRKGGEAVSRDTKHMAEIGRKGGEERGAHRARARESPPPASQTSESRATS